MRFTAILLRCTRQRDDDLAVHLAASDGIDAYGFEKHKPACGIKAYHPYAAPKAAIGGFDEITCRKCRAKPEVHAALARMEAVKRLSLRVWEAMEQAAEPLRQALDFIPFEKQAAASVAYADIMKAIEAVKALEVRL